MKSKEEARPRVSRWESIFLTISNLLIVTILIMDLFQMSGLGQFDLPYLTLANLIILCFAFFSYRIKRRIRMKAIEAEDADKKGG